MFKQVGMANSMGELCRVGEKYACCNTSWHVWFSMPNIDGVMPLFSTNILSGGKSALRPRGCGSQTNGSKSCFIGTNLL
jgi:hypothetical protein